MSRYRKIDPRIWNDAKFRRLDDRAKLVFFMLLTHPAMTSLGAMRATPGGLAEELGWPPEAFREAFAQPLQEGMAEHDAKACFVGLPKFLSYNPPESPNVVTAWLKSVDLLPECELKARVLLRAKAFAEAKGEAYGQAFAEAFAKAMPNQEQEQEQEPEEIPAAPNGATASPPAGSPMGEATTDKGEIFKAGRSLLESQGVPVAQCGSFLGGLISRHGEANVLEAVRAAVVEQPADAKGWLVAACKAKGSRGAGRSGGKQASFDEKDYGRGFGND